MLLQNTSTGGSLPSPTVDVLMRLCGAMKTRAWRILRRIEGD